MTQARRRKSAVRGKDKANRPIQQRQRPKEERIQHIMDVMAACQYVDGVTPVKLATEWKLSLGTVQEYAAEASRRVKQAVADPDWMARLRVMLADTIAEARRKGQLRTVIEGIKVLGGFTLELEKRSTDGESAPSRDERDELVAMLQGLVARDTPGEAEGQAAGVDSEAGKDPSVGVAGLGET